MTTRKSPVRKSPAKKTAAKNPAAQPVPPVPPSGPVIGILCGREIEVLPVQQWRTSAMEAMRQGDLTTWAERCLTEEGLDVWDELDPTFEEVGAFFATFSDEMAVVEAGPLPGNRSARRSAARGRR